MQRASYLAGQWYPADGASCRAAIQAHSQAPLAGDYVAAVVPHAGWFYSGDAMGKAYASLAANHSDAELVVVFGSHLRASDPATVLRCDSWQTPLGAMPVSPLHSLWDFPEEEVRPASPDNAVEVQLPFIRYFFPNASLLMFAVPPTRDSIVLGQQVAELCPDKRTIFIGSTDLTHYGRNYGFEPMGAGEAATSWVRDTNDREYVELLMNGELEKSIDHARKNQSACCPGAAAACWSAAQVLKTEQSILASYYLSSDVRPGESFVGYASILT